MFANCRNESSTSFSTVAVADSPNLVVLMGATERASAAEASFLAGTAFAVSLLAWGGGSILETGLSIPF